MGNFRCPEIPHPVIDCPPSPQSDSRRKRNSSSNVDGSSNPPVVMPRFRQQLDLRRWRSPAFFPDHALQIPLTADTACPHLPGRESAKTGDIADPGTPPGLQRAAASGRSSVDPPRKSASMDVSSSGYGNRVRRIPSCSNCFRIPVKSRIGHRRITALIGSGFQSAARAASAVPADPLIRQILSRSIRNSSARCSTCFNPSKTS